MPAALRGDSSVNWGILGTSNSQAAVVGISNGNDGLRGATNSSTAFGVSGTVPITGVNGIATNTGGSAVYGRVTGTSGNGVYGYSDDWNGVRGSSNTGSGVAASSNSDTGLYATSGTGFAINVDGDAKQTFPNGGIAKAMAYISYNSGPGTSSVVYCYNSRESGSAVNTPPCNFTWSLR